MVRAHTVRPYEEEWDPARRTRDVGDAVPYNFVGMRGTDCHVAPLLAMTGNVS